MNIRELLEQIMTGKVWLVQKDKYGDGTTQIYCESMDHDQVFGLQIHVTDQIADQIPDDFTPV